MYRPTAKPSGSPQQTTQYDDQAFGQASSLPFPTQAILDETGEPVTLLQTCEWKGHSPSNIGVDAKGKQFIASFAEVTVVDHRVLPNPLAAEIRGIRR
jgi:hypothetical protein